MKRICVAMMSLFLTLTLFPGALCAEAVSTTLFDEVSTFPSSPFDFYTKLCMINNTLSQPYQVELCTDERMYVTVSNGGTELLFMDFDQIVRWENGHNNRELMGPEKKFERCDYINTYPRFRGLRMDEHVVPEEVLEVQMLVQMACDPQIKRIEDAEYIKKMTCDIIYEGETKELHGIVTAIDSSASYGVMLSLRDTATEELDNMHH